MAFGGLSWKNSLEGWWHIPHGALDTRGASPSPQARPYHGDSTGTRPLSEVKLRRARLVLRWETTLEVRVLCFLLAWLLLGPDSTAAPQAHTPRRLTTNPPPRHTPLPAKPRIPTTHCTHPPLPLHLPPTATVLLTDLSEARSAATEAPSRPADSRDAAGTWCRCLRPSSSSGQRERDAGARRPPGRGLEGSSAAVLCVESRSGACGCGWRRMGCVCVCVRRKGGGEVSL